MSSTRILSLVYQRDAGPGVFAEAAAERGGRMDTWFVAEQAEPPADPAGYDAVMIFGGAMHVDQEDGHPWLRTQKELVAELIDAGKPLLGACLGAQILVKAAGGEVRRMPEPEIGWFDAELPPDAAADPVIGPLAPRFTGFNWHSYECLPPDDAVVLARSEACIQAFRLGERAYGIQFHAEVSAADANKWIDEWDDDEDAVRVGLDHLALRSETDRAIEAWNAVGRDLCGRFLDTMAVPA